MKKIAVLGAEGSFSSIAAKKYINKKNEDKYRVLFYKSLNQIAESVGKECDFAVIPLENSMDGYVHIVLDILTRLKLHICSEIVLPVEYSLVGNCEKLEKMKKIYVQFKTKEQCTKFLEKTNIKLFTTESNSESFEMVNYGIDGDGAVLPNYLIEGSNSFKLKIDNIADGEKNETRFIVISGKKEENKKNQKKYKSLILVEDVEEREKAMSEIVSKFSESNIKLISIISRATKMRHGKYHFFIDISGDCYSDEKIKRALESIEEKYEIKLLGSYDSIR